MVWKTRYKLAYEEDNELVEDSTVDESAMFHCPAPVDHASIEGELSAVQLYRREAFVSGMGFKEIEEIQKIPHQSQTVFD